MSLSALPDTSRIWIFGATEPLTDAQQQALDADLTGFVRTWAAHGSQLMAAHRLEESTFVVVGVDETVHGASGCSIDSLVRHLSELETALDVSLLDGARIWYRTHAGDIVSCERSEFTDRSKQGEIDAGTRVFDPTIQALGDLRRGDFERAAGESWHARLLASPRATGQV
jgi:hypothetical protein